MVEREKFVRVSSMLGGADIVDKLGKAGVDCNYLLSYSIKGSNMSAKFIPYDYPLRDFFEAGKLAMPEGLIKIKAHHLPRIVSLAGNDFEKLSSEFRKMIPHNSLYRFHRYSSVDYSGMAKNIHFNYEDVESIDELRQGTPEDSMFYSGLPVSHIFVAERLKIPKELSEKIGQLIADGSVNNNPHLAHLLK